MLSYTITSIFLLLLAAFFSAGETSLIAVSKPLLKEKEKKGSKSAKLLNKVLKNPQKLILLLVILNNCVAIFFTTIVTSIGIETLGEGHLFIIGIFTTLILITFGELLPKSIALSYSYSVSLFLGPLMYLISVVTNPLTKFMSRINKFFVRITNFKPKNRTKRKQKESLASLANLRGAIDLLQRTNDSNNTALHEEKLMLNNVLDLPEININEIMIHRKNVFCIDIDSPKETIVYEIIKSGFSKIPVYKNTKDNLIGIIYLKELLKLYYENPKDYNIKSILKPPIYFPETSSALDLLLFFQENHEKIVIVVDEYGGFMGIIAVKDVLEEIVGELKGAHINTSNIIQKNQNSFIVNGDMTIRDLNRKLKWSLPDNNATTIAGLILYETGKIPNPGNIFALYNFKFEILEKKKQQIIKIKITPIQ